MITLCGLHVRSLSFLPYLSRICCRVDPPREEEDVFCNVLHLVQIGGYGSGHQ